MIVELNIEHFVMYDHLDPMNDEKSTKIIWFFVDIQADYGGTVRRSNHKKYERRTDLICEIWD